MCNFSQSFADESKGRFHHGKSSDASVESSTLHLSCWVATVAGMTSSAQPTPDPTDAELAAEEQALQFALFSNADAFALGSELVRIGVAERLAITIDIRRGTQQLFHAALEGTSPDNDAWIERKVRAVYRFNMSSFRLGCQLRAAGRSITQAYLLDESEYAAHGGAFPIAIHGSGIIGVLTVSGLPQRDDHALVVRVLTEWIGRAKK
jgi:uncharacterized protein (UPF0303 family)